MKERVGAAEYASVTTSPLMTGMNAPEAWTVIRALVREMLVTVPPEIERFPLAVAA
jgi:hypothetical protein